MIHIASCHSDPAVAGEESLVHLRTGGPNISQRYLAEPVLSEAEGLNMTNSVGDSRDPNR